jgi:hypothetical protein
MIRGKYSEMVALCTAVVQHNFFSAWQSAAISELVFLQSVTVTDWVWLLKKTLNFSRRNVIAILWSATNFCNLMSC